LSTSKLTDELIFLFENEYDSKPNLSSFLGLSNEYNLLLKIASLITEYQNTNVIEVESFIFSEKSSNDKENINPVTDLFYSQVDNGLNFDIKLLLDTNLTIES
ncbi:13449_t:CDS:1, partial [Funneliformis caledonium]